jgi:SfnB family sulfur acquisition oxidoreductase
LHGTDFMTAHIVKSEEEALKIAEELRLFLETGAAARDHFPSPPKAELDKFSASGILAITIPSAYGGAGVSYETIARIFQLLSAGDPGVSQMVQSHYLFLEAIGEDGTEAQKSFFFQEILRGARLGNAQAEKGSTSALDLATRLLPDSHYSYILNGTKYYCTGALLAHWLPVAAFDEQKRFVLALVPRNENGVNVLDDWDSIGQRVAYSGTATFESVSVPADHVIPHYKLFGRVSIFHPYAQLLHTAIDVGIAQNALADAVATVRSRNRPRLGAPVPKATEDPHVILRFGQLATRLHAAELLLYRAGRMLDAARADLTAETAGAATVAVAEAKAFAEEVGLDIANDIFSLSGTSATERARNLDRHWRNIRTHSVHDANHWRYHVAGDYLLNHKMPGKPVRQLTEQNTIEKVPDI